jgi:phosphatidate cytidylyltransferase
VADERDRGPEEEDPFEGLDKFFEEPLEDWPDDAQEGPAAPEKPAEAEQPAATPPGGADWGDLEIDIPDEAELVGAAAGPGNGEEAEGEQEEEAEVPAGEKQESDWDRIRGEMARGVEEEGAPAGEGAPADEAEALLGEAEAAGDEPLSLEDLSAAPPEYSDLPQTGDEEEAQEEPVLEEEAVITSASELFEEDEEAPPMEPGATAELGEAGDETPAEEEAEPEAIEAAAEHFASGIRPEEVEQDLLADLEEEPEHDRAVTIDEGVPAVEAPTWQEGGHVPVAEAGAEAPAEPTEGRDLTAAFASGVLLAAAVIALLAVGKGPFTVLAAAVVLLGQLEFYTVMRDRNLQPATLLGLVGGAFMIAGAFFHGASAVLLGLFLTMAVSVLWYMAAPAAARRNTTVNAGVTVLGALYVPFLASFAILLLTYPGNLGRNIFLTVIGLTVLYDVCAYAIGSLWGSRPLAPTISPQKSWEGAIGATFILLLVALAIVPTIEPFTASRAVGLAMVIAVVAPLGDLVESALKRDLGVKDMGTILPGHGGVLDRIDAILFAAPAAYYFLQLSLS